MKFETIVRGSSFAVLLEEGVNVEVSQPGNEGGGGGDGDGDGSLSLAVQVDARGRGGASHRFMFDLGRASTTEPWYTDGVRIEC